MPAVIHAGAVPVHSLSSGGSPEISGDYIVWNEDTGISNRSAIYIYGISTGELSIIPGGEGDRKNPDISGDYVVWEDYSTRESDIYLYDIGKGEIKPVCTRDGNQLNPRISGSIVTYTEEVSGGTQDICIYDLRTSEESCIEIQAWDIAVTPGEDYLAIFETVNSGRYLSIYDISSGDLRTVRNVTYLPDYGSVPRVSGNTVIWAETDESGNIPASAIFTYDISTGRTNEIFESEDYLLNPDIDGEYAVWESIEIAPEKRYSYDMKVVACNLNLGDIREVAVTKPMIKSSGRLSPKISGDYVVWKDSKEAKIFLENIDKNFEDEIEGDSKLKAVQTTRAAGDFIVSWVAFPSVIVISALLCQVLRRKKRLNEK